MFVRVSSRPILAVRQFTSLAGPVRHGRRIQQPLWHNHQQRRHAGGAAGIIGVLATVVKRTVVVPAAIITGIGAAADGVRNQIPEVDLPFGVRDLADGVSAMMKGAKSELDILRNKMTPERGNEHHNQPPPKIVAAAEGGDDDDNGQGNDKPDSSQLEALEEQAKIIAELRASLVRAEQQQQDTVTMLEENIAHLEGKLAGAEDAARQELLEERARLQQEIDVLKLENEELHRVNIINAAKTKPDKAKRAIDLFSDILDLRSKVDRSFAAQERLPRVVVVGDQSAGKTSVLEVLVRARIFPRGAGEMMTRAPIQVTLSEGRDHTAKFKDADRLYHLKRDSDLEALRSQIEKRMIASVQSGDVVSATTLALDLRGPGLQPMVLVDLPGIIQHHTKGMPGTTKGAILDMCQHHINNPNSIILCVQDASRDAEASSVADLVRKADPKGDRTVFVLTKVDLAEKLKIPATKLKSVLQGDRFNMQARAYFAVVTGTANPNDSIEHIRNAERKYFQDSAFFKEGVFSSRRAGTDNLSRLVSDIFWERVRETVAAEAAQVQLALKQKETEWKNMYPNQARLSRDDLFNMGRHDILQNITEFNDAMTAEQWEQVLHTKIWATISPYVLNHLYVNCSDVSSPAEFKTRVENALDAWASSELPKLSVKAARDTLMSEFLRVLTLKDPDGVFDKLKEEVKTICSTTFEWDPLSINKIKSVQELMLRDDMIRARRDWDQAVKFMSAKLTQELAATTSAIQSKQGSSTLWRWLTWTSLSQDQREFAACYAELQPYFTARSEDRHGLNTEELRAIELSLKRKYRLAVEPESIQDTFDLLFRQHFLQKALASASYCRSKFNCESKVCNPPNGLGCYDVMLFWRLNNMLEATVNMLRLEAMEYKRELQERIRDSLNDISADTEAKTNLISGKRVTLAEEIEVLRHLQSKLDAFTKQLKKEGKLR
eukprot:TRINITY_DN8975_c0_g1_i3.p1 TRINITY_DN8975_c0_g1~~TRINITY_DN8975_c0_g1_i3.p1  ORF type:complete len:948 (+),score=268.23 TRINITY_DN8975_c0_g1_i3:156-2999(+)